MRKLDLAAVAQTVPYVGAPIARHLRSRHDEVGISSEYWDDVYRRGGSSGPGSYGRLSAFKAEVLNDFIEAHGVQSVVELGCGDGYQVGLVRYPRYIGIDTSPVAVALCRERFLGDVTKTFLVASRLGDLDLPTAELAVSLDVIYHLLEDESFETYMSRLFRCGKRFVAIYATDTRATSPWPDMRNRKFTDWIAANALDWSLLQKIPNRYRYSPRKPTHTSLSDFYFYERPSQPSLKRGLVDRDIRPPLLPS
ncbi:MAG TPA: class I SAM-dependent methyltransferase [Acidimicrobiales bacterium]|nr:class I SAM-dependent methyltransferase [Acidimicrobiales bacterium]